MEQIELIYRAVQAARKANGEKVDEKEKDKDQEQT